MDQNWEIIWNTEINIPFSIAPGKSYCFKSIFLIVLIALSMVIDFNASKAKAISFPLFIPINKKIKSDIYNYRKVGI